MKEFLKEIINQIFWFKLQSPRSEFFDLTTNATIRMQEYQIDIPTLEDSFKYGIEIEKGLIFRQYANYWVKLRYVEKEAPIHKNLKPEKRFFDNNLLERRCITCVVLKISILFQPTAKRKQLKMVY